MNKDLISIVVPVYNVENYIKECIESIIKQTYNNLEIILVDDGSTDNSGNICESYKKIDNRIMVIHKENGGPDARNEGIKHANGKYIQFVDSDDYIDEDMVETLYNAIKEKNADVSMCAHYILKNGNIVTDASFKEYEYTKEEVLRELLLDRRVRSYVWDKLFDKKLFNDVKYPKRRLFEDILTMPKIFNQVQKVVLVDVPKYYYRQREGSILHKQTVKLGIDYIDAVLDMHDYMKTTGVNLDKYINYNLANLTLNTFNNAGLFNMKELVKEEKVKDLYNKLKKLFENKETERFIIDNSSNVMKIHYYYLLENPIEYVHNNKHLPLIYPEQEKKD